MRTAGAATTGDALTEARLVLRHYALEVANVEPIPGGLINLTLLVTTPQRERYVLQRLHRIFRPEVNATIDRVTRHLAEHGLVTPRLIATLDRELWVTTGSGCWRLLSHIDGVSFQRMPDTDHAYAAGSLFARFHAVLATLPEVPPARAGVHDLPRHLAVLRAALAECAPHPLWPEAQRLATRIFALTDELPALPITPSRVVHGDPKLSNLIFDHAGRGLCLIDLDTLSTAPLTPELGDAFRSWCNPAGEDALASGFSLPIFAAAVAGYAAAGPTLLTEAEQAALVTATQTIYLELAARFCADALYERYFGWDPVRFASRGHHNLMRAQSQLTAAESLLAQSVDAHAIVQRTFAAPRRPRLSVE